MLRMSQSLDRERRQVTLDPQDWDQLLALGHRMLDDMFHHFQTLHEQPAWQPLPTRVVEALDEPLPVAGQPVTEVYEEFLENVLPYTSGNRHPRAWGWVRGNGTPLAMLADMLASGINAHAGGGQQAPTLVEQQVLTWMKQVMGMPASSSGLLTSGCTTANMIGLAVARHAKAEFNVRKEGLQGSHHQLMVYTSSETHMWVRKSVEFLGLGTDSLRRIPTDSNYRIRLDDLERQIESDRKRGLCPIAVLGNAGTVNTGAIDDLQGMAELCRRQELWFHIDGAFGALLKMSPRYAPLVRGLELADSLAFDLHKWGYLPFDIGCLLVRDADLHNATFATEASYLEVAARGLLAGGLTFTDRGIELSRSFKALKAWMSFKTHGIDAYAAMIEQNMEQADYLASLVTRNPRLELLAPRTMNIVCFRYVPLAEGWSSTQLNTLNRELVMRLQESGKFLISGTVLQGEYALRVANVNHRSRMEDFSALVDEVIDEGDLLAALERDEIPAAIPA
jgi:aromatic-L-amino-acid decarboxylase